MGRGEVYFLSHESPVMWDTPSPARNALLNLGKSLRPPKAVLFVTPHWQTKTPAVSNGIKPKTIHDFGGFPPHYFQVEYPAPGEPALAQRVQTELERLGLSVTAIERGFDHATWIVSALLWPEANIPIVQISVQPHLSPEYHFHLGKALRPLIEEGYTLIASGTWTHNLGEFFSEESLKIDAPQKPYVREFSDWMLKRVSDGSQKELFAYRKLAPHAYQAHPSPDHIVGLFVALGAALDGKVELLHRSTNYGHLEMVHLKLSA